MKGSRSRIGLWKTRFQLWRMHMKSVAMSTRMNHEIWATCPVCGYEYDERVWGDTCPECARRKMKDIRIVSAIHTKSLPKCYGSKGERCEKICYGMKTSRR